MHETYYFYDGKGYKGKEWTEIPVPPNERIGCYMQIRKGGSVFRLDHFINWIKVDDSQVPPEFLMYIFMES